LPDFSWYSIPKRKKTIPTKHSIIKWPQNIPNGRKIHQMAFKITSIFHCMTLENLPKFWFENMPSGNPTKMGKNIPNDYKIDQTGIK
jgi:hypothetical protein